MEIGEFMADKFYNGIYVDNKWKKSKVIDGIKKWDPKFVFVNYAKIETVCLSGFLLFTIYPKLFIFYFINI